MALSDLLNILTCGCFKRQNREPESAKEAESSRSNQPEENHDLYGGLSEVASPAPVQRIGEEEQARRPSLEQNLFEAQEDQRH